MKKWNASFYQSIVHVVEKCLKSNALLFWFWITTQRENNWNCLLLKHIAYSWITRNTSVLDSIPWDFDFSHRFTFWPYRVYHKVKQNRAICLYYLTFQPFFYIVMDGRTVFRQLEFWPRALLAYGILATEFWHMEFHQFNFRHTIFWQCMWIGISMLKLYLRQSILYITILNGL